MNLSQLDKIITDIETNWGRYLGKVPLLKHLRGQRITQLPAIQAKCYDCMGGFEDGAYDCEIERCPLYRFQPYLGKMRPPESDNEREINPTPEIPGERGKKSTPILAPRPSGEARQKKTGVGTRVRSSGRKKGPSEAGKGR